MALKPIDKIRFRFGASGPNDNLEFEPTSLNLLIGPNNSGKSLALRELLSILSNGSASPTSIVELVEPHKLADVAELNRISPDLAPRMRARLEHEGGAKNIRPGVVAARPILYYQNLTSYLPGSDRLAPIKHVGSLNLSQPPRHPLERLYRDSNLKEQWRSRIHKGVNLFPALDPSHGNIVVKFCLTEPDRSAETVLTEVTAEYFRGQIPVQEVSDGVAAYSSLITTLIADEMPIVIIDEPEAFLSPPLTRQLGADLAELAVKRQGQVFAATHSADFLMGGLNQEAEMTILRLSRDGSVARVKVLSSSELREMMREPLLRSTNFTTALFFNRAVLCEGDTDRVFYNEIWRQLSEHDRYSANETAYLNGYGKNTLHRLVGPLRRMGVPTAVIVDLDIFEQQGGMPQLLRACNVPDGLTKALGVLRGNIVREFERSKLKLKQVRIDALDQNTREMTASLIQQVAEYGLFVVPCGELEGWIPHPDPSRNLRKPDWLQFAFEQMASDSNQSGHAGPDQSYVRQFVRSVHQWTNNPSRKGM